MSGDTGAQCLRDTLTHHSWQYLLKNKKNNRLSLHPKQSSELPYKNILKKKNLLKSVDVDSI